MTPPLTLEMPVHERLAIDIPARLKAAKYKKINVRPCHSNQCSELGHECERYLVYRRTQWQQQQLHDVNLQFIFDEGHHQEVKIRRDLEDIGLMLTGDGQQYRWDELNITGHIDGKIIGDNGALYEQAIPYDAKTMSPYVYDKIDTLDDFKKYTWTRKYPAQLYLYMLLTGTDTGLFVLKNKTNGQIKCIPLSLDYEYSEELLQRAERINKHVADGTLPDRIEYAEDLCGNCPFNHICTPEQVFEGLKTFDSPELDQKVSQLKQLEPNVKRYKQLKDELDNKIKPYFKKQNTDGTVVIGRNYAVKASKITQNIAAKEAETREFWRMSYVDISKIKELAS